MHYLTSHNSKHLKESDIICLTPSSRTANYMLLHQELGILQRLCSLYAVVLGCHAWCWPILQVKDKLKNAANDATKEATKVKGSDVFCLQQGIKILMTMPTRIGFAMLLLMLLAMLYIEKKYLDMILISRYFL